ncbi:unnamed protein product [Tilletia caries]|uniref:Bowman-Birk serine protease inhibitors family domain-containing protein n=1 Tax=Tilletia caries TaxID=13290 RepID=A0ABN7JCK7_9BASI|nr:unnamed protein product [Tilletia caries]CAD6959910.1 unnamed protein product [Tilletia caries]CAD6976204.1 unnamed protein product [Tilletia controversa]
MNIKVTALLCVLLASIAAAGGFPKPDPKPDQYDACMRRCEPAKMDHLQFDYSCQSYCKHCVFKKPKDPVCRS